ncbi:methionyl-tRNA formyltransferase [Methylibium sp.]|uniref:methionyl-tRNA formyltransferase n=1 Tax=Methylibium sp. TaxID=2067992 RepID=UPI00286B5837|nr:methionyl-tRNA formyltransferase [Methylibium sp.]
MRLGFAGTPEFARVALEHLLAAGFEVALTLTQPDRPAGRGMKLAASPVKSLALERGIQVVQPRGLRLEGRYAHDAAAAQQALADARLDMLVVAAYGLILPRPALVLPRLGCLNIHASLLPRWRGAAPIQRAIEAGDEVSGITIMQMDEGLDTGDMLMVEREPITAQDTTATLQDRLARLGGRLVVEAVAAAAAGRLVRMPQPAEGASYARKIEKAEGAIDWSLPAVLIERRVRAFDPAPGANFRLGSEAVKVWSAAVCEGTAPAGTVLRADGEALVVACGVAALSLLHLQRPGGRRIGVREFSAARPPVVVGERL